MIDSTCTVSAPTEPLPPTLSCVDEETPGPVPSTFTVAPMRAIDSVVKPRVLETGKLTGFVMVILHFPSKHSLTSSVFATAVAAEAEATATGTPETTTAAAS